jgi:hypothetical protein
MVFRVRGGNVSPGSGDDNLRAKLTAFNLDDAKLLAAPLRMKPGATIVKNLCLFPADV